MNTITLSKIIEAILLSSGRPLSEKEITNLFDEEEKPSHSEFQDALDLIEQNSQNNSFTLSRKIFSTLFHASLIVKAFLQIVLQKKPVTPNQENQAHSDQIKL